ncbi:hypothetical protein GTQ99_00620 [Kineococcus sp. T13]|uniref:hypothetical protein n=1 Tax=Kineococcus vitellinus TaxID=2696565 RepID=UPI001411E375|nr:hypothetical protein [Kineococcus vitellinus]NAZ73935.1 hypothetical protein [Kineococcus vitellinus]
MKAAPNPDDPSRLDFQHEDERYSLFAPTQLRPWWVAQKGDDKRPHYVEWSPGVNEHQAMRMIFPTHVQRAFREALQQDQGLTF